jgi:hypothetical protein
MISGKIPTGNRRAIETLPSFFLRNFERTAPEFSGALLGTHALAGKKPVGYAFNGNPEKHHQ